MTVRMQVEALDVRRTQLPRIRLKALEEPAFAPISVKPASQPARRGPPSGRGGACYLSRQSIAPVRGHARQWAHSGIEHQGDDLQLAATHLTRRTGGRRLRKSYPTELRRRGPDTYEFRPADRTDDYSASDFVISEALQQTDFDGIRHGVLSGWTAPLGIEPRIQLRGSIPLPATITSDAGLLACRELDDALGTDGDGG